MNYAKIPGIGKHIFEVYARDSTSALALAHQLVALKQSLERGSKGIPDALTGLNQAIESLYAHTAFHKMGHGLYCRTIESTITLKAEDLVNALQKSLHHSKRKLTVKTSSSAKKRPHITLVRPVKKDKSSKKRKAS